MSTETLRPNADGDVIELINNNFNQVNNWSYVDEEVADDFTTNVFGAGLDLYNLPAHSGSGTINKITVYARIYTGAVDDYARIAIKTGTTTDYSGNLTTAVETWENKSYEWAVNPDTEVAWTWSDIDDLQIGIECIITSNYSSCTQLYVEVDYTPSSPSASVSGSPSGSPSSSISGSASSSISSSASSSISGSPSVSISSSASGSPSESISGSVSSSPSPSPSASPSPSPSYALYQIVALTVKCGTAILDKIKLRRIE